MNIDYEREVEERARKHRMLARIMTCRTPRELILLLLGEGWDEKTGVSVSEADRKSVWTHPH